MGWLFSLCLFMEQLKPQPTPIKDDVSALGLKVNLSNSFRTMGNFADAEVFYKEAAELGRGLLDTIDVTKANSVENYGHLYHALRDLKAADPDQHQLVIGVLREVQRERIPIKPVEPVATLKLVYSRGVAKS